MTSSRHRSFATKLDLEPITFDIDDEEFTAVSTIPGGVLLDIAQTLNKEGTPSVDGISDFFNAAIIPEDHERFAKVLRKPDGPGIPVLVEIVQFLVEEYTGFPTVISSGSHTQQSRTGPGSSVRQRSSASTSKSSQRKKR